MNDRLVEFAKALVGKKILSVESMYQYCTYTITVTTDDGKRYKIAADCDEAALFIKEEEL